MEFDEFDEFDGGIDDLDLIKALDQIENNPNYQVFNVMQSTKQSSLTVDKPIPNLKSHLPLQQKSSFASTNQYPPIEASGKPNIGSKVLISGQQTSLFDHFKSMNSKTSKIPSKDPPKSLLSLNTNPIIQSKPKAYNPKRPGAVKSYHPVDDEALKTWIYPINYSIRDYQFNIAQSALFSNTLVCLPTGLGKTFIASVVIYNYLRWFPKSCVVFTAPTKPLVTQQVEACRKITGIENDLIAELTGNKTVETRRASWKEKRLFFMTPETFRNDLQSNCCDVEKIALVIFDEAHRASGHYAYCEVIKALENERAVFRVLALSATPANDPKKVQGVIQNLYIERLQLRTEDSFDVVPFIFKKTIEEIVVKPSPLMASILEKFLPFLADPLKRLKQNHCINDDDPEKVAPFALFKAKEGWRTRKSALPQNLQGYIEGDFALAQTLAGFRDLLNNCGIRAFYEKVHTFVFEIKQKSNSSKRKLDMVKNANFVSMMQIMEEKMAEKDFSSHPKLDILVNLVVEHFKKHEKSVQESVKNGDTDIQNESKVMIFSTLRNSVEEICTLLEKHSPLVRPSIFVGQATSGKNNHGMKQKEQLQMMENFRNGLFNVIVATSIGEEGLDIGELDLIICFDNQKSPIRMLQRCGRTGRKRKGKICLLVNEGAEQNAVKKAKEQYKAVQNSIIDGSKLEMYCGDLAAILPEDCNPECSKKFLVVADTAEKPISTSRVSKNSKIELAQLIDYMTKNQISFKNIPKINLTSQTHWQTTHLPIINVEHSSLSSMYVNLMEFCHEQRLEEAKTFPAVITDTLKEISIPSSIQLSPLPSLQVDKKKPKFKFDNLLDEAFSDDSDLVLLHDLPLKSSKQQKAACMNSFIKNSGEIFQERSDNNSQNLIHDKRQELNESAMDHIASNERPCMESKTDMIVQNYTDLVPLHESNGIAIVDGSQCIDEFSDLGLDMSFGDDKILEARFSFDNFDENENIAKQRTDSVMKDDHVFLAPSAPIPKIVPDRILIPLTPTVASKKCIEGSSSSIVMQRKKGKVHLISESSSNLEEIYNSKERMEESDDVGEDHCGRAKKLKRHGSSAFGITPAHKKSKKEILQNYVDIEVDVSSGHDPSSDEEGSYLDQDLSSFIAPANHSDFNSSDIHIGNIPAFYRESLLQSNPLKYGNKFKLSRGIALRRPLGSGTGLAGSSENDSLNSLEEFICQDDEVDYESQVNSLLDDSFTNTQYSSIPNNSANSEQKIKNNSINFDNVEDLDLSDMLDF